MWSSWEELLFGEHINLSKKNLIRPSGLCNGELQTDGPTVYLLSIYG